MASGAMSKKNSRIVSGGTTKKGGGNVASWRYNVIPSLRSGVVTTEQNGDLTRCGGVCWTGFYKSMVAGNGP